MSRLAELEEKELRQKAREASKRMTLNSEHQGSSKTPMPLFTDPVDISKIDKVSRKRSSSDGRNKMVGESFRKSKKDENNNSNTEVRFVFKVGEL